jgi:hypothetical protein
MADLGDAVQVRQAFVGMQRYLYIGKKIQKDLYGE